MDDIRKKYKITSLIASDSYVYFKIKRGTYGLKQVARLAREQLIKHLKLYRYFPSPIVHNIWIHQSRPTKFCLCVDDFGVKFFSETDANH